MVFLNIFIIIVLCCLILYYLYLKKDFFEIKLEFGEPVCNKGGREENQDHFGHDSIDGKDCFVIADGLGGHRGGKLAAITAVDTILDNFKKRQHQFGNSRKDIDENVNIFLRDSLLKAHREISEQSKTDPQFESMKSTCVILVIVKNHAYFTNIGDSRIYFIKNGEVVQKSRDHSVVQILQDMNEISEEDILGHPDKNRVLKALGMEDDFSVQTLSRKILKGEYIILCTDGFWEYFTVKEIELFFCKNNMLSTKELLDKLYYSARDKAKLLNEKYDNITIQLIKVI